MIDVNRTWGERRFPLVFLRLQRGSCGHPDVWSTVPSDWLFVARPVGAGRFETDNCLGNLRMVDAADTLTRLGQGQRPRPLLVPASSALTLALVAVGLLVRRIARRR